MIWAKSSMMWICFNIILSSHSIYFFCSSRWSNCSLLLCTHIDFCSRIQINKMIVFKWLGRSHGIESIGPTDVRLIRTWDTAWWNMCLFCFEFYFGTIWPRMKRRDIFTSKWRRFNCARVLGTVRGIHFTTIIIVLHDLINLCDWNNFTSGNRK